MMREWESGSGLELQTEGPTLLTSCFVSSLSVVLSVVRGRDGASLHPHQGTACTLMQTVHGSD